MNVVVTGAAGYIGSVVSQRLIEAGHKVMGIDKKSLHVWPKLKYSESMVLDIRRREINDAFNNVQTWYGQIDAVVHTAALASVPESLKDPAETFSVNLQGSINVLAAAIEFGAKKFINSSSAAVYGPSSSPIREEGALLDPATPYGASKLAFERVLEWEKRIVSTSFRYFNVGGAILKTDETWLGEDRGTEETHIIPLLMAVVSGRYNSFTLSDGSMIRDYVEVNTVARAHMMALAEGTGGVYNVCAGEGTSNDELIDEIETLFSTKIRGTSKLIEGVQRPGDPQVLVGDPAKLYRKINRLGSIKTILETAWSIEAQGGCLFR